MSEIPLKDYIDRIFSEKERSLELVAKSLEHRLQNLNELRADVIKDRDMFITKDVHNMVMDRLAKVEAWQSRMIGVGMVLMALSGLIGAVIAHLIGIK